MTLYAGREERKASIWTRSSEFFVFLQHFHMHLISTASNVFFLGLLGAVGKWCFKTYKQPQQQIVLFFSWIFSVFSQISFAVLLLLFLRPEGLPYLRGIRVRFTPTLPATVALALCMYSRTVTEALPTQLSFFSVTG